MFRRACIGNLWLPAALCALFAISTAAAPARAQDAEEDLEEIEDESGLSDVVETDASAAAQPEPDTPPPDEAEAPEEKPADETPAETSLEPTAPGDLIVIAFDSSYSMNQTDPKGHAKQAVQLIAALAGPHDRVAVVSYGPRARTVVRPTELDSVRSRLWVQKRIARIGNSGGTNFAHALEATAKLLESAEAPEGTRVLLVSDGRHTQGGAAREVIRRLRPFRDRSWRIHTISLSRKGRSALLEKIAELTGGMYVQPTDPRDLLPAILRLSGVGRRYWTYRGDMQADLKIEPGARSLIYLAEKAEPQAGIESVRARDTEIPGAFHRYPRKRSRAAHFDLLGLEDPPAGLYSASVRGKFSQTLVLQEPPFRLEIDAETAKTLYRGDSLRLKVAVVTDGEPEVLAGFRDPDNVQVEAEVIRLRDGESLGFHPLALQDESGDDRRVLFVGQVKFPELKDRDPDERYSVRIVAEVDRKSRKRPGWVHEESFEIDALNQDPPIRILLSVAEEKVGSVWTDAAPLEGKLTASMEGREAIQVEVAATSEALAVEPKAFELKPGSEVELSYSFDPSKAEPGELAEGLTFSGTGAATGGSAAKVKFELRGSVYRLSGLDAKGRIVLNAVRPPESSKTPVALAVEPEVAFQLAASPLQAEGQTGLESRLDTQLADNALVALVPRMARPGSYGGTLTATFAKTSGLAPRKIPMILQVKEPLAELVVEPEELRITFDKGKGWANGTLKIKYVFVDDGTLELKPGDLTGEKNAFTIAAEYDILLKPLDGWDGKTLTPGTTHALRFKVAIGTDMRDDRYVGPLKLTSRYKGKVQATVTVNVAVDVRRKQ